MTLERLRVGKRDGGLLVRPPSLPETDGGGLRPWLWQKLMIYSSEQAEVDGVRQHEPLLQSLRASNARGAHARDLGLPRQLRSAWRPGCCNCVATSPSWTVLVDRPGAIVRSFAIVDELTRERSLVTSEIVPALSALTEQGRRDGLRLARPRR